LVPSFYSICFPVTRRENLWYKFNPGVWKLGVVGLKGILYNRSVVVNCNTGGAYAETTVSFGLLESLDNSGKEIGVNGLKRVLSECAAMIRFQKKMLSTRRFP
jgi:hypothetical protein